MPTPTPVTTPAFVTVATTVLEELHVAWLVTTWVLRSESVAVAINAAVWPTFGVAPVTARETTDAADVGVGEDGVVGAADDEVDEPELHDAATISTVSRGPSRDRFIQPSGIDA
jgi:hypothetical protein